MEFSVSTVTELIDAINSANSEPSKKHRIDLAQATYTFKEAPFDLFGANALPIITSNITINGNGQTLQREDGATPFRFFTVNMKSNGGHHNAKLTLNHVKLLNGDSGDAGGGAIAGDGGLVLINCDFENNRGSLGGAVFCGDITETVIATSRFKGNYARARGGAIYCSSSSQLTVVVSHFDDNRVYGGLDSDIEQFHAHAHLRENTFTSGVVFLNRMHFPI